MVFMKFVNVVFIKDVVVNLLLLLLVVGVGLVGDIVKVVFVRLVLFESVLNSVWMFVLIRLSMVINRVLLL